MKAVVCSCAVGLAIATPSPDVIAKFHEFRNKWGHNYGGAEYHRRLEYFESNLREVQQVEKIETGTATYSHLGPFADFSEAEKSHLTGSRETGDVEGVRSAPLLNMTGLPSHYDWVGVGAVNPIQYQNPCGSCWAFSAVANLEGAGFVSGHRLGKFSEQQLMDCSKGKPGCNGGGVPVIALQWTAENGGLASEEDYPYLGSDGTCHTVGSIVQNTNAYLLSSDEHQMVQSLLTYGPLAVGVNAQGWDGYSGGVMRTPGCKANNPHYAHAVNIVGYGPSPHQHVDQTPYWKIRNSWSQNWGEFGYAKLYRGECTCGVCKEPQTATGVTVSDDPAPSPPAPPAICKDTTPWCPKGPFWLCAQMAPHCRKSCGCCGKSPPDYCFPKNDGDSVVV